MVKINIDEILKNMEIDMDVKEVITEDFNLKAGLSSLGFLKMIMSIEDMYQVKFSEEFIKKTDISFLSLERYIDEGQ